MAATRNSPGKDDFIQPGRTAKTILEGIRTVRPHEQIQLEKAERWLKTCRSSFSTNPSPSNLGRLERAQDRLRNISQTA